MKALFLTVDAGGNVPPEVGVAQALARRGAQVQFLGHAAQRAAIDRAGFAFESYPTAGTFDPLHGQGMISGLRAFLSIATDRRVGKDAIAVVRRDHIDVVIADVIVHGGIQRLVAAGIPTACLAHSFFAFAEDMSRSPVGLLMRLRGLDSRRVERSTLGVLVTTRRDLDPAQSVPPDVHYTGVVWQGTPVPATRSDPPTVLVSLSTVAFPGQQRTLQAILDALAGLPVQAIVTTGPAIEPSALRAGANTRMHAWVDHADVLPTVSLVIGHGGHSTTMRALSYGIPVLVIPSHPMLDQRMVGNAVTRAGVGATLARGTSSERIAADVTRLLGDQSVQHAASALGENIRHQDGATVAADLIEGWVNPASRSRSNSDRVDGTP